MVTGGSSGIGRSIALALAAAGAERIGLHYRSNRSGAEATAAEIEGGGCRCALIAGDLASAADVRQIAEAAWRELGSIHTWVNNAGADVLTGEAGSFDFDTKLRRLLEVDVVGTIHLSRLVADRMRVQSLPQPPSIVFLGWDQAPHGMEGDAGQMFGPTKAAVMAFAASLAQQLAPAVRVNTVAPGWIRTAWGESTQGYWDRRARGQSLMRRWGTPQDVARAVLYAADPRHSFVTGQVIEVNGGWDRGFAETRME